MSHFREPIRELSELERVWLACAIDTEGCITFSPRSNYPRAVAVGVTITNTDLCFLDKAKNIVQAGRIAQNPNKNRIKPCFRWELRGINNITELLQQILPYLIIKKGIAERVILFAQSRNRLGNKRYNTPYNAFEKSLMGGGK